MKKVLILAVMAMSFSCSELDVEFEIEKDAAAEELAEFGVLPQLPREEWIPESGCCDACTSKTSCAVPPPEIKPPTSAIYIEFTNAFNNGRLGNFFQNSDYESRWGDLSDFLPVINGVILGTHRCILVQNGTLGIDYYLFGLDGSTDSQIKYDPLMVLY